MRNSCQYVCKPGLGSPFLIAGQRNGQSCTVLAADGADEDYFGKGHNPLMVRHAQVRSRAFTIQLVLGGNAAVRCSNSKHKLLCEKDFTA